MVGYVAGTPPQHPFLSDTWTRASKVEGARINGCGALTISPSSSANPSRSAGCARNRCPTSRWTTTTAPTSQRHMDTNISSAWSAYQRVRCSHMAVSAVSRPSSIGSGPVNPRPYNSLSPTPTSHHHVNPGVYETTSQPPSSIRSVASTPLVWRRCELQEPPFKGEGGKRTGRCRSTGCPGRSGTRCDPPASQRARGVGACRSEEAQRRRTARPRSE